MPTIKPSCPQCGKLTVVISEEDLRVIGINVFIYKLQCGHSITEDAIEVIPIVEPEVNPIFNGYGARRAFPYQIEGVEFIEHSNFKCLLGDEMGVGKTPQALLAFKKNKANLTPTIVICKSSLHINWAREYMTWVLEIDPTDTKQVSLIAPAEIPWIHPSGELGLPFGFNIYLVSMDMLSKKTISDSILALKPKCLIVDECHNFKSLSSKRTVALQKISEAIPHKVMLSGTAIMNKTLEYFPTLNIIKPNHFPTAKQFTNYLDWDWQSKKYMGFTKRGKEAFFNITKDYILRREAKDVQKDLPKMFITNLTISSFDSTLAKKYNKLADELEDAITDSQGCAANATEILGIMTHMRQVCGLLKVPAIIEYVTEFMESNPDKKICVGIHHIAIRSILMAALAEFQPIEISGEDNGKSKDEKLTEFKRPERRILIANILAGGEGLNMQFCNNFVVAERQWNPAKERQFHKRFHRQGQIETVFGKNIVAADTMDDFFEQLLQFKSTVVDDTVDQDFSSDHDFLRDLAAKIVSTRLRVVGC